VFTAGTGRFSISVRERRSVHSNLYFYIRRSGILLFASTTPAASPSLLLSVDRLASCSLRAVCTSSPAPCVMASPYHRPGSQDGESDDERDPFTGGYDPSASTDRVPLTQAIPDQRVAAPAYSASPPATYSERPVSRYTLSENYVPSAQPAQRPPSGAFPSANFPAQRVRFPDAPGQRPVSVMSNMTEDWIARQQPVEASQADLRRYQTRRVKLTRGSIFSADYPYVARPFLSLTIVQCSQSHQECCRSKVEGP